MAQATIQTPAKACGAGLSDGASGAAMEVQQQIAKVEREKKEAAAELKRHRAAAEEAKRAVDELASTIAKLEIEVQKRDLRLKTAKEHLQQITVQREQLMSELAVLREQFGKAEVEAAKAATVAREFEEEVKRTETAITGLREELADIKKLSETDAKTLAKSEAEQKQLTAAAARAEQDVSDAKLKCADADDGYRQAVAACEQALKAAQQEEAKQLQAVEAKRVADAALLAAAERVRVQARDVESKEQLLTRLRAQYEAHRSEYETAKKVTAAAASFGTAASGIATLFGPIGAAIAAVLGVLTVAIAAYQKQNLDRLVALIEAGANEVASVERTLQDSRKQHDELTTAHQTAVAAAAAAERAESECKQRVTGARDVHNAQEKKQTVLLNRRTEASQRLDAAERASLRAHTLAVAATGNVQTLHESLAAADKLIQTKCTELKAHETALRSSREAHVTAATDLSKRRIVIESLTQRKTLVGAQLTDASRAEIEASGALRVATNALADVKTEHRHAVEVVGVRQTMLTNAEALVTELEAKSATLHREHTELTRKYQLNVQPLMTAA